MGHLCQWCTYKPIANRCWDLCMCSRNWNRDNKCGHTRMQMHFIRSLEMESVEWRWMETVVAIFQFCSFLCSAPLRTNKWLNRMAIVIAAMELQTAYYLLELKLMKFLSIQSNAIFLRFLRCSVVLSASRHHVVVLIRMNMICIMIKELHQSQFILFAFCTRWEVTDKQHRIDSQCNWNIKYWKNEKQKNGNPIGECNETVN